ncbi:MAG: phosphopantothenoylcysteine decarboxylase [Verrucomicrobiales bacterium]
MIASSQHAPRLLVTAGPTHEAIDPVRYIANRSSGKMGFALAARAAARGWSCLLVAGPVHLPTPTGVERVDVVSAEEMYEAVASRAFSYDAAIHSAAVADFRPLHAAEGKIKKSGHEGLTLELTRTRDILGSMRGDIGFTGVLVGFAAETSNLLEEAERKYRTKGCDLLVANDVSRPDIGFGSDFNEVLLISPPRPPEPLPRATKESIADAILDRIAELLAGRGSERRGR